MATFKETVNYDPTMQMLFEAMTTAEIAERVGVTRTQVGRVIKKCLGKFYKIVRNETNGSPFEVALTLKNMLNIDDDQESINRFLKDFPTDIKTQIEEDARKKMEGMKKRTSSVTKDVDLKSRSVL